MKHAPEELHIQDVQKLTLDVYKPFAEIIREVPWPQSDRLYENDAEHSFSLALVGMALGGTIGLNPEKITYYAISHDLPEVFAGDVSVWDEEGRKKKAENEAEAVKRIKEELYKTPVLGEAVDEYNKFQDEESRFVYALDKLMPFIMVVADGNWFRKMGISHEKFLKKHEEQRVKVAKHPVVLQWYDEMFELTESQKDELFDS